MCAVGNGYDVACLMKLSYAPDLEWPWVLVIPLLAIAAIFVGFLTERARKRKANGRFRERETLSFDDLYDTSHRNAGLKVKTMSRKGVVNPTLVLLVVVIGVPLILVTLTFRFGKTKTLRWVVPVAMLGAAVLLALISPRLVRAKRLSRLAGREYLPFDVFYDNFYSGSGLDRESVEKAVRTASETLRLPAGLLRPSDRFDVEYKPPAGYEMDDEIAELDFDLEAVNRKRGSPLQAEQLDTLDDYIRIYCRLLKMPELDRRRRVKKGGEA